MYWTANSFFVESIVINNFMMIIIKMNRNIIGTLPLESSTKIFIRN